MAFIARSFVATIRRSFVRVTVLLTRYACQKILVRPSRFFRTTAMCMCRRFFRKITGIYAVQKIRLIKVNVYFVAFSAQRDTWIPTARHDKRIDMRRSILSSKSVNGLSPRADEATPPEENTTNPKMPTPRPLAFASPFQTRLKSL